MSANHKDWKFIFEKFEKPVSGIVGTIRTIPENYWVATVKSDGKIVFDSFDAMVKDIDKDTVQKLWDENKIEEKVKNLFEKGGRVYPVENARDTNIPAGMIVVVKDTEDEANKYIKDKKGLRVEALGDKWAIKTYADGGSLSTSESMLYAIQNHISSGYIGGRIFDIGYEEGLKYDTIEKVRQQMILILQEHGDETYSIDNLNKLIVDGASIVLGKKDMQSRGVGATHFADGGAAGGGEVKIKWSRVGEKKLSLPAAVTGRLKFSVYSYDKGKGFVVSYKYWDYPEGFVPKVFDTYEEAKGDCEERAAYFKKGGKLQPKDPFFVVMNDFRNGWLYDEQGKKITSRGQALGIALSESKQAKESGKYESGGETAGSVEVHLDGYPKLLTKIDSTHFYMSSPDHNPDARYAYHVGQFKDSDSMELYNDLVKWLHGDLDINGKRYKTIRYAAGGAIQNNYEGKSSNQVWDMWDREQRLHFLFDHKAETKIKDHTKNSNLSFMKFSELPAEVAFAVSGHIKQGQYAAGGETGKKLYSEYLIGNSTYAVNFYDGKDRTKKFESKEKRDEFIDELKSKGYTNRYAEGIVAAVRADGNPNVTLCIDSKGRTIMVYSKDYGNVGYGFKLTPDNHEVLSEDGSGFSLGGYSPHSEKYFKEIHEADKSGQYKNHTKENEAKYRNMISDFAKKENKLASGGHIGFAGLEKKVAKEYAGKSVADKYKKQYGSTYDAAEAKEVAAKVAGKVKKQQAARKKAAPAKKGAKKTKPSVASKYK